MIHDPCRHIFQMSAQFVADMLGADLYRDTGACLWELVRNGACACMPDSRKWSPEKVRVEVSLDDRHPLAAVPGTKTLVVVDHGCGFTKPNLEAFFMIGPEGDGTNHRGAAQKRIGKFAAFALNRAVAERNYGSGFYILSRTSSTGDVLFLEVTPDSVSKNQTSSRYLSADSAELGGYRNVQGSFTALVVPNVVFETTEQVRNALRWYLPRKQNHAISVTVGRQKLAAPELCTTTGWFGEIEAFLGRRKAQDGEGGIWLADAVTSLRCAHAPAMGVHLPYPLGRPDLEGDIFIPGLLENQGTDRSGLRPQFLRSKAWKERIFPVLQLKVAPLATQLLGEDDVFQDTSLHDRAIREIAELFNDRWGKDSVPPPHGSRPHRPPSGSGARPSGPGPDDGTEKSDRPRGILISIGGTTYRVRKALNLDPFIYAELNDRTAEIFVNEKYRALPNTNQAMREHVTMQFLGIVACSALRWDTKEAQKRQAELRAELLTPKK